MNNPKTIDDILSKHIQELRAGHEHLIIEQIRQLIEEKLPKDYNPDRHDPNACLEHEKYTSACCGCQRQRTRVSTLSDVRQVLNEMFKEEEE